MPTTLGKVYPVDWRGRPPHMLQEDIPVWYRFLEKWGQIFTDLYYDVLLGGIWLTPEQQKDSMWVMWRANTAKRADAIAETPDSVWIIEVASHPGLRALGQLLTYESLWLEDPKITKPAVMVLVCETVDTDLFAAAIRHGIQIYLTPAPTP